MTKEEGNKSKTIIRCSRKK